MKWTAGTEGFLLVYAVITITVRQLEIHCGLSSRITSVFTMLFLPLILWNFHSFSIAGNTRSGKVVR